MCIIYVFVCHRKRGGYKAYPSTSPDEKMKGGKEEEMVSLSAINPAPNSRPLSPEGESLSLSLCSFSSLSLSLPHRGGEDEPHCTGEV